MKMMMSPIVVYDVTECCVKSYIILLPDKHKNHDIADCCVHTVLFNLNGDVASQELFFKNTGKFPLKCVKYGFDKLYKVSFKLSYGD